MFNEVQSNTCNFSNVFLLLVISEEDKGEMNVKNFTNSCI